MMKLRPALAKCGVSTSFSSSNTLRNHLSKNGPRSTPATSLPGVYKIQCEQCPGGNGTYFGETGLNLPDRMKGHSTDITKKRATSSLWTHMQQNPGHLFNLDNPVMLDVSHSEKRRKLVESSLIANFDNLNIRPGDIPVCRITAPAVLSSLNIDYKPTGVVVPSPSTVSPTTDQGAVQVVTPPRPAATVDIAPVFTQSVQPSQQQAVAMSLDPIPESTERQTTQPTPHDIPLSTSSHRPSRPLPFIQLTSPSVPVFLATRRKVMQRQQAKSRTLVAPYRVTRTQASDSPIHTSSQPPHPIAYPSSPPTDFPPSSAPSRPTSQYRPPTSPFLSQPASAVPRRLLAVPTSHIQTSPTASVPLGARLKVLHRSQAKSRTLVSPYQVTRTQSPHSPPRSSSQPSNPNACPPISPSDFPSSSAPPSGLSVTTSRVPRLTTDWLPAEYLQSPSIPLTSNTRMKRAQRYLTRDHQRSTPYQMSHQATGSPTSNSQRPSLLWRRKGRLPKQMGKPPN